MMGYPEKIWNAFTAMIKLEGKVTGQGDTIKSQQHKIENLTERVIRLETQMDMLLRAAAIKRIKS
jgi:archaellum component FlaC